MGAIIFSIHNGGIPSSLLFRSDIASSAEEMDPSCSVIQGFRMMRSDLPSHSIIGTCSFVISPFLSIPSYRGLSRNASQEIHRSSRKHSGQKWDTVGGICLYMKFATRRCKVTLSTFTLRNRAGISIDLSNDTWAFVLLTQSPYPLLSV